MKKNQKPKPLRASTETYEVEHSADPQVHQDAISAPEKSSAAAAEGVSEVMVRTNPVELEKEDDGALNEPLKYVVSAPEAIDKAEVLLKKVKESRPDLASEVDSLLDGVENLENKAMGLEEAAPIATAAPAPAAQPGGSIPINTATEATAGGVNPGDRVVAQTKDGEFAGVVEDINEDGTLEILTDKNMKLSHVPADSVKKEEQDASGSMALPAGIQSSRRNRVNKNLKAKASPLKKEMGAGTNSGKGAASAPAGAPSIKSGQMGFDQMSRNFMRKNDVRPMGEPAPRKVCEICDGKKVSATGEPCLPCVGLGTVEVKADLVTKVADLDRAGVEKLGERVTRQHDRAKNKVQEAKLHSLEDKLSEKSEELDLQAEMAVKAARISFMAGTLDLTLVAAYHPAAQAEVQKLLADKTLKFAASAFDKIDSLDIGGGMTAKRSEGKDEVKTVAILDKDGKEVARYPDAFGDDTVTIIKLFRQLHDIKESDDKAAAKGEGSESSDESKKPKALPKIKEKKEKEDEKDKELAAAEKNFNERLSMVREIVSARVSKRYVVAQQDDIDTLLLKGMGLEASMNEALKTAVDREVMRLLALPDTELPSIRASLGSLKPRPIEVETQVSNEGIPLVAGLRLYAEKAEEEGLGLQGAFGSSYRR